MVVSNTSPITNLAAIGQLDLLPTLFGEVQVPTGVWDELNFAGRQWPGAAELARSTWVQRRDVSDTRFLTVLRRDLGRGEAEAIASALEAGAERVLLDEKEGRHVAADLGLRVVGILIEAKSRLLLARVRPHLEALRTRAGFYLAEAVYRSALELAGESEPGSTATPVE